MGYSDRTAFNFLKYDVQQKQLWGEEDPSWPLLPHVLMVIDLWTWKLSGWPRYISIHMENSFFMTICFTLSLRLTLISFICSRGVFQSNTPNSSTIWCITSSSISRVGCLLWQAMCGMSGSGAYLTFPLWFLGATAPFLLLSVVPDCKLTAVHQIRTLEEECCFRWESIFPFASGENSSALKDHCFR